MSLSLGISLLMIILLLVIQYNGFAKPVIILTTLPLALIGSFLGLYVTGNALGFMPQLGLLALFGIVVNTAIIFIEFADILIKEKIEECDGSGPIMGMSVQEFRECLVQAGQVRLLPYCNDYSYNDWRPSSPCSGRRPSVGRHGLAHDFWFNGSNHPNADCRTFALRHICRKF